MDFSIYKQIIPKESLIRELKEKGMVRKGETQVHTSKIIIENEQLSVKVHVDFFFKLDREESSEIKWAKYWGEYFGDNSKQSKIVESAYGVIITELGGNLYAISLGRGHSYVNTSADLDFGFNIAERVYDNNSIEVKSARFLNQSKSRALTQYHADSFVSSEVGESHELVVSKIKLKEKYSRFLLSKYSDNMKFGTSVRLSVNSYEPTEILDIIHELDYLLRNESAVGGLSRMILIKENEDNLPLISDLNRRLLNSILKKETNVSLSYFMEDNGEVFINPENDDNIEIVYKKSYELESFSIDSLATALEALECEDISKVSIRLNTENTTKVFLMKLIDYSIDFRGKTFCLYKGKWASFNKSYMDFINREISKVNDFIIYDEKFNLNASVLKKGRKIQKLSPQTYDQVKYAEYPYNIYLEHEFGYELLDRKNDHSSFKSVEFADLYNRDEEDLIHVKIGNTTEMRYCIKQSLHSADIYNMNRKVLEEYNILNVSNISMLFITKIQSIIRKDGTIDISKIKSIYFKIEIIEWLTKIRSLNYNPKIIIAQDLRNDLTSKSN
ncbi:conserved hypothetical protein [Exiguobacterium sp. 8H]|uniref:DUF6119 family protein n=1 Tax=unclassified Exiguobacterium TaxID=2644629 RepID=UPI0012F3962A|nr:MULTISPECIES: DUF6119 family protein [unclassified Exiguobacterium]VXA93984.1 conserved hypothetical protein [Exiguobacterium sp. 8A]VXA94883.1 conserved hypothetical protein [Exiguobacterium sp. 8H]